MTNDNEREKPSEVDAVPGTGEPKKPNAEPGKTSGTAETEAQPDKSASEDKSQKDVTGHRPSSSQSE